MTFDQLNAKHREWTCHARYWGDADLLYRGGAAVRENASRFLVKRPVEPNEVYAQRCARFSYQNILATAIGWYLSALFEQPGPQVQMKGGAPTVEYLNAFLSNADGGGTALVDLAKGWFERLVLDRTAYVLIDLPGANGSQFTSVREQIDAGALDAYLVSFTASQVTNWGTDRRGNLDWVLITTEDHRSSLEGGTQCVDRWYYFDRETFTIYESPRDAKDATGKRTVQVVATGRHALAAERRVPVRKLCIPESLWLAYRVYPQILDHLNEDNGLGWKLLMSNLAVPVITGEYEQPPTLSETAYIQLGKGSTFTWSEPSGNTIEQSSKRLDTLRQEIYRQMYLQAQGRNSSATAAASSAVSKEMDMQPGEDVLNAFGGIFRRELAGILADVALVRGDRSVQIDVQGLVAEEEDDLEEITAGLELDIPSPTLRRHMLKRAARCLAEGASPETLATIDAESDAAPAPDARAQNSLTQPPTTPPATDPAEQANDSQE